MTEAAAPKVLGPKQWQSLPRLPHLDRASLDTSRAQPYFRPSRRGLGHASRTTTSLLCKLLLSRKSASSNQSHFPITKTPSYTPTLLHRKTNSRSRVVTPAPQKLLGEDKTRAQDMPKHSSTKSCKVWSSSSASQNDAYSLS